MLDLGASASRRGRLTSPQCRLRITAWTSGTAGRASAACGWVERDRALPQRGRLACAELARALEDRLEKVLTGYAAAYGRDGRRGLPTYANKRRPVERARRLSLLVDRFRFLNAFAPAFYAYLREFGPARPDGLDEVMDWSKEISACGPCCVCPIRQSIELAPSHHHRHQSDLRRPLPRRRPHADHDNRSLRRRRQTQPSTWSRSAAPAHDRSAAWSARSSARRCRAAAAMRCERSWRRRRPDSSRTDPFFTLPRLISASRGDGDNGFNTKDRRVTESRTEAVELRRPADRSRRRPNGRRVASDEGAGKVKAPRNSEGALTLPVALVRCRPRFARCDRSFVLSPFGLRSFVFEPVASVLSVDYRAVTAASRSPAHRHSNSARSLPSRDQFDYNHRHPASLEELPACVPGS